MKKTSSLTNGIFMLRHFKICCAFIAALFISSCSDTEVPPQPSQESERQVSASEFSTESFDQYKWWNYVPRAVCSTQYHNLYSTDANSWQFQTPVEVMKSYRTFPAFIQAFFVNGQIWLFQYEYGGRGFLSRTSDGFTWDLAPGNMWSKYQKVCCWDTGGGSPSFPIWPEMGLINGAIYSFFITTDVSNMKLIVRKFNPNGPNNEGVFNMFSTQTISGTVSDNRSLSPSYAFLNNEHYLIFRNGPTGSGLKFIKSTDLVTWTTAADLCTNCPVDGKATDATTMGGYIYISVRKPDYGIAVVKWGGSGTPPLVHTIFNGGTGLKTRSTIIPIATDGSKVVVSLRGNGDNDKNYITYSLNGTTWTLRSQPSSSYHDADRELIYTPF